MRLLEAAILGLFVTTLSGCGGGGGNTASQPVVQNVSPPPAPITKVSLSGQISFDRIPHNDASGLDYSNTIIRPIRGAVVEAVDAAGSIVDSTVSGTDGRYELSVDAQTDVRVQVKAQLLSTSGAMWDVSVTDNTQGNQLYVMQGSLVSTGGAREQVRDLHAAHGWTGSSYGEARTAAPFAILDSVYGTTQAFVEVDPNVQFPPLLIHWSVDNITAIGDRSLGHIGKSAYFPNEGDGVIYILGQEDADTDEYDQHVIIHEWGHYFEHRLSRTDSIGGLHALDDRLDARVAFSEGWANALSAIITGDPIYRDASGFAQGTGFSFDLEALNLDKPGWFSEASVGAIIYDVYNNKSDDVDDIAVGLAPIYNVMRSEAYKSSPVFATIFSFADGLRLEDSVEDQQIDTLLDAHAISGAGPNGNGEVNNGAIGSALPVYKEITLQGAPVQFCSTDDAGVFNKLGNRDFTFLTLSQEQNVKITVSKISGAASRDPDFNIWQDGQLIHRAQQSLIDEDSFEGTLQAGEYIIEAYDFLNISGLRSQRGDSCYDLRVEGN
ncbi:MAG: hypothetical protein ABJ275_02650 [Maricaulaceae bacterium]